MHTAAQTVTHRHTNIQTLKHAITNEEEYLYGQNKPCFPTQALLTQTTQVHFNILQRITARDVIWYCVRRRGRGGYFTSKDEVKQQ